MAIASPRATNIVLEAVGTKSKSLLPASFIFGVTSLISATLINFDLIFVFEPSPMCCWYKKAGSSANQIFAVQHSLLLTAYQLPHNAEKLRCPYVVSPVRHYSQAEGSDHTARLGARAFHDDVSETLGAAIAPSGHSAGR